MKDENKILYFESHVTIEPVFDKQLEEANILAMNCRFKLANLLMQKREEDTPERSKHDTFMTAHSQDEEELTNRMVLLIIKLKQHGFKVWRYKIERVPLDSRYADVFNLIDIN